LAVLRSIAKYEIAECVIFLISLAEAEHLTLLLITFIEVFKCLLCCDHKAGIALNLGREFLNF